MARVFISYKRADKEKVLQLRKRIEVSIGEPCWMDFDSIDFGAQYARAIIEAIDEAQVVLFMYSKNCAYSEDLTNDHNIKELRYAMSEGKRIVFISIDQAPVTGWYAFMFPQRQVLDLADEKIFNRLVQDIKQWVRNSDPWVFISHSSKDFESVRLVRNALEKKGYRPILLYLKCMDNENEIDALLKREIDARHWFILCDSPNAQASKYVQSEVKYIRSRHRTYDIIDINKINISNPDIEDEVLNLLRPFQQKKSIFLNYSIKDNEFAAILAEKLRSIGFTVFNEDSINQLTKSEEIFQKVGCVISLITPDWANSAFAIREVESVYSVSADKIYPVMICTTNLFTLPQWMQRYNIQNVSNCESDEEKIEAIIDNLLSFI